MRGLLPVVHTDPSAGARVVVVVVSWNTAALLDRCLRSLRPHAESGLAEVWVLDNASDDGSAAMVAAEHRWVHLIASRENLGYGRAINVVANRTASPWLAVANADVALRRGALEALLAAATADSRAGVVAPRLLLPDGSTQHSVFPLPFAVPMLMANLGPRLVPSRLGDRLVLRGRWNPDRPRRVPWAVAAFLLVRRAAWDEVGGFDARQWMSAEDLDLGWRMHEAGWATRYEPRALVDHEESAATGQLWGDGLAIHWQRCAYAWMLRRRGRAATALIGAINLAGSAARLLLAVALAPRRPHLRARLRGQAAWTAVHLYALAPRRTLDRYR